MLKRSLYAFLVSVAASASAIAAPIAYDEAVDGDLSNFSSSPTVFSLDSAGTSTISFFQILTNGTGGDSDSFRIDLASGIEITGLTLSLDASSLTGRALSAQGSFGMVSVSDPPIVFVDPTYLFGPEFLLSGSESFTGTINESIAFLGFGGVVNTPLGGIGGAEYDMTLTITSTAVGPDPDPGAAVIPLPASMWLLLAGSLALGGAARCGKRHA
jgi:hypothetical protein